MEHNIRKEAIMKKDATLTNIYLKIHNKKPLTMDDLRYLAEYAPECFEKTCKNVVHNMPETKHIMQPIVMDATDTAPKQAPAYKSKIQDVLDNIIRLEANELPLADIEADKVKNLLGNLYMELLFSHTDQETVANMLSNEQSTLFDTRI